MLNRSKSVMVIKDAIKKSNENVKLLKTLDDLLYFGVRSVNIEDLTVEMVESTFDILFPNNKTGNVNIYGITFVSVREAM